MTLKKLQPRAHWYALVCIATYLSGCAITNTNDLEAVTPEPIAPAVQAVTRQMLSNLLLMAEPLNQRLQPVMLKNVL